MKPAQLKPITTVKCISRICLDEFVIKMKISDIQIWFLKNIMQQSNVILQSETSLTTIPTKNFDVKPSMKLYEYDSV